jgi:DNA processing protein
VGRVTDEVLLARALLSRIVEPASIRAWRLVRAVGPVEAAAALRAGRYGNERFEAEAARAARADPHADLEAAERHGLRLVVPESEQWPHFAFAALETAGLRRTERYDLGDRTQSERGEPIPPLALWARGPAELSSVGVRSVAIVGARGATEYGEWVARDFAGKLAARGFVVVSGGAYGIDAAAHRGALSVHGQTVLVSAGGLDTAYPPGHDRLFEQVAECGLLISESPPGCAPRRRRFLTRNRLIAALGTGTLVVEAAARSGALNTAHHSAELGRPLMAVPGPITSAASAGCHRLLGAERGPAQLITRVEDVLLSIGVGSDLAEIGVPSEQPGGELRGRLDGLDPTAQRVFDALPTRGAVAAGSLAVSAGLTLTEVLRSLPVLELAGLVEEGLGGYRIRRPAERGRIAEAAPPARNG